MRKITKQLLLVLIFCLLALLVLASCDMAGDPSETTSPATTTAPTPPVQYALHLSADKTEAVRGEQVTLTAVLRAEGKEDIPSEDTTFTIVSGGAYAVLQGNVLTVRSTAPDGATVVVQAKEGVSNSNTVSLTVRVPVESISASAGGVTNILAGGSVQLTKTVLPAGAPTNAVWEITEGDDIADVNGDMLIVKPNAETGATVKVRATLGGKESEELTFTVGYPLSGIMLSYAGGANILPGTLVPLTVSLDPENATNGDYTLEFISGKNAVIESGNFLTVKSDAPTGTVVRLKAVTGTKESNEIFFTVGIPLTDITLTYAGGTNILPGNTVSFAVECTPKNATNGDYVLDFLSGEDAVIKSGTTLTVKSDAVTGTVVKFRVVTDTKESGIVSFIVGYPLTDITVDNTNNANLPLDGAFTLPTPTLKPANATNGDYRWEIVEGGEYAELSGNTLTVKQGAATGKLVKVRAVTATKESNVLTYVVGYPLTKIEVSLLGSANMLPETSAELKATLFPSNTTNGDYRFEIVEGGEYAELSGAIITVKKDTPLDTVIKVRAVGLVESDVVSEPFTIVVNTPIDSLSISSNAPAILDRGGRYPITLSVEPADANLSAVEWRFEKGGAYASVVNGELVIAENTPAGTEILLYAASGDKKSETLDFTVGIKLESITVELVGNPERIEPGESCDITAELDPTNASDTDIKWVITEGADYAIVANGVISVKSGAKVGESVTFHAEIVLDAANNVIVKSNDITVIVGVPVESVTVTLTDKNIDPGDFRTASCVIAPANSTHKTVEWVISVGNTYATINNSGVLTIGKNAKVGDKVTFYAVVGGVKSNEITVTVGTPVTKVTASTIGSAEVVKGNTVSLRATYEPTGATVMKLAWQIVSGGEYGEIIDNTLVVFPDAKTGEKIIVKAVADGVESEPVEITVKATPEEIAATRYNIQLSEDTLKIDKRGAADTILKATVRDGNFNLVENIEVEFEIIDGKQYLDLDSEGKTCEFTALGHGQATVLVKLVGYDVTATVSVNVIVPPDAVDLPEVFRERPNFEYSFSLIDPRTKETETLPFVATPFGGEGVCQDLVYDFAHEDGSTGAEVATYENGVITFKKMGKVTVTVTSASGSRVEASSSYVFRINDGYNANNFEELRSIVRDEEYNGQIINLVVLEKPKSKDPNSTYEYGYDLVPPTALLPESEQTVKAIVTGGNRIQAVNRSLWINGNNHTIDGSQMKPFTYEEYVAYAKANQIKEIDYTPYIGSLLSVETWPDATLWPTDGSVLTSLPTFRINLYDLAVKGNSSVNYSLGKQAEGKTYVKGNEAYGCYKVGMRLGIYQSLGHNALYNIDADNIRAEGFTNGIELANIVGNGKVSNVYAGNCYQTGILTDLSVVTIENMTFGPCGATGIEMTTVGQNINDDGFIDKHDPEVTLSGTVDASANKNNGQSLYFQNYTLDGATIPMIIDMNIAQRDPNVVKHIRNDKGEYIFVALILKDLSTFQPNETKIIYPAFQDGGIINIDKLSPAYPDTTHEYIEVTVSAPIAALGGEVIVVGTALFYNYNYGG